MNTQQQLSESLLAACKAAGIEKPGYIAQNANGKVIHHHNQPSRKGWDSIWGGGGIPKRLNHPPYAEDWKDSLLEWVDHIAGISKKIDMQDAIADAYRKHVGRCGLQTYAQTYRQGWLDALEWKAMEEEENHNELTSSNFSMEIRLERHDEIPAFGAFLRCEEQHDKSPVIYLNVQTCMLPELENETGAIISMSRDDRKHLIIESLMHEFGHALESHFRIPVNEDAIESACIAWERAYALGREGGVSE